MEKSIIFAFALFIVSCTGLGPIDISSEESIKMTNNQLIGNWKSDSSSIKRLSKIYNQEFPMSEMRFREDGRLFLIGVPDIIEKEYEEDTPIEFHNIEGSWKLITDSIESKIQVSYEKGSLFDSSSLFFYNPTKKDSLIFFRHWIGDPDKAEFICFFKED